MTYYYRIVHGSFKNFQENALSQRTDKVDRFCQTHTVVAVACLCSMTSDVLDWKAQKIDDILHEGDIKFFQIEEKLNANGINVSNKTIAQHIKLGFKSMKNMIELDCNQSLFGTFESMLNKFKRYMDSTPNGFRRVLFKSKKVCYGIFDFYADDMSVEFCLFDPNGRSKNGFYDYNDGYSSILLFNTIENLFALIERDDLFNHSTVECIPIRKVPVPAKPSKMLVYPFLARWINDPLMNGDETDSGESETDSEEPGANTDECDTTGDDAKVTRSGRKVEKPDKYECETHPSFWRGKERQDAARLERNKISSFASRSNRHRKIYNSWRRFRYRMKHH